VLLIVAAAILLTWAVCAVVLIGLGALALRPLAGNLPQKHFLSDEFWMGLTIAVAVLEIWSLFLRVSLATPILLGILGLTGLAWNGADILRRARKAASGRATMIAVFAAIVIYIALRAAGPCNHFDTGLYGEPAIRWIEAYPAVPGLANVHGRLGFDSAVFLCVAAMGQGFWRGLGFHLFTGFVLAAMWTAVLPAWPRLLRLAPGDLGNAADWFHAILVIPAAMWSTRAQIVGTASDEPANVVCLLAAGILIAHLARAAAAKENDEPESKGERNSGQLRLVVAAAMLALAVAFKISTIVFAALAWVVCFGALWSASRGTHKRKSLLAGSFVLPAVILIPWLARNLILSGYPFFPSTFLGIRADWRVPQAAANVLSSWVHSWGRNPDAHVVETQGWEWFLPWLLRTIRMREQFQIPMLFSVGGAAAALIAHARLARRERKRWLWLLAPSLAGLVFWFMESPDTRFGAAAIWTTGATLGALGILSAPKISRILRPRVFATGILIAAAWCLFSFGWQESFRPLASVHGFIALPEARVAPRQTRSGLTVYVPINGQQCWDAPLPCTPYFDPTLQLRTPGRLRDGFRAEGQVEWPPY
jgi:hypothetical protein